MKNKITKKSTIRDVMQILGTNLLREGFNNNIHVAATLGSIKENEKIIITDLRFPNEFEAVKDRGGITIKVVRKLQPGKIRGLHYSETTLDNETRWDYVIDNSSTIEDLIKKVREILNKENII